MEVVEETGVSCHQVFLFCYLFIYSELIYVLETGTICMLVFALYFPKKIRVCLFN